MSDSVARMTFTTGSKVSSGFTPQKDEEEMENTNAQEVEAVKKNLSDRFDMGDGVVGATTNGNAAATAFSTPVKSRVELTEEQTPSKTPAK